MLVGVFRLGWVRKQRVEDKEVGILMGSLALVERDGRIGEGVFRRVLTETKATRYGGAERAWDCKAV